MNRHYQGASDYVPNIYLLLRYMLLRPNFITGHTEIRNRTYILPIYMAQTVMELYLQTFIHAVEDPVCMIWQP